MFVYVSVCVSIILIGLYYESINSQAGINKKKLPKSFFIIPTFVVLFIVSAFRGDFTTDYNGYARLFNYYNQFDLSFILQSPSYFEQEIGFVLFSRIIGIFTDNELYLFIITSLIILLAFYSQFKKDSLYLWLSVLLFVTIGPYYTSFNIMRHILAAAIIFAGSKYLYERKAFKYFLVVIIASFFHVTSLIMIPFYYILNLRIKPKNLILLFVGAAIMEFFLNDIVVFFQNTLYSAYDENSYGMTGMNFTRALVPIAISLFSLFFVNKLDSQDTKQRVWFNAVVFYGFFHILGLQVEMVERLSEFFVPYVMLLIPLIFHKMQPKELRVISIIAIAFLLIAFHFNSFSGSGFDPYYFIWES